MCSAKCNLNMDNNLHFHKYIYTTMTMSWIIVHKNLAAYTQQIHLSVKGTICASFSITSQVQQVLNTLRYPRIVCCSVLSRKQLQHMACLKVTWNGITAYLKHPFPLCQNNYAHYLSLYSYLVNPQNPWI